METPTQDLSQRGEWTSASNAQADLLCKGRHLAQKGLTDIKSEDAAYGTAIHEALKKQNDEGLTPEQQSTYEACNELEDKAVAFFFPEANGGKSFPTREARYWIKWADGLMHSGQLDAVHVFQKKALIVEYKMLPGDVPLSSRNMQLRDQAVLLKFNVPTLEEIGVIVIQPLVTMKPELTLYKAADLEQAMGEMYFRVRASNTPGQPRTPGEAQCKFCLARSKCPEYNQFAGGMVISTGNPAAAGLMSVPITEWSPEMQVLFLDRLPVAQKWLNECKSVLKGLLKENPNAIPGYTLNKGRANDDIINPNEVFANFAKEGGKLDDFMKCVTVGKGKLVIAVKAATKLKGKALDAKVVEVIGNNLDKSTTEPSIVKVK